MSHNDENENRKPEVTISLKNLGTIFLFVGGLISAWVALNSSLVETNTRVEGFIKYYDEYKKSNEKSLYEIKELIKNQDTKSREISDQLNSLENSVSQLYRPPRRTR